MMGALLMLPACVASKGKTSSWLGDYSFRGTGWYAGETLRLEPDRFEYHYFTDVMGIPPSAGAAFSVTGKYQAEGDWLKLEDSRVKAPQRHLLRHQGRYVILTPAQNAEYRETRKLPRDALYQVPSGYAGRVP